MVHWGSCTTVVYAESWSVMYLVQVDAIFLSGYVTFQKSLLIWLAVALTVEWVDWWQNVLKMTISNIYIYIYLLLLVNYSRTVWEVSFYYTQVTYGIIFLLVYIHLCIHLHVSSSIHVSICPFTYPFIY